MYFPAFGGCSSLIHLIAQHWRVSFVLGILGTVAYVNSSLGPGEHKGTKEILKQYEIKLASNPEFVKQSAEFEVAFQQLKNAPPSKKQIEFVLHNCGKCTDIKVEDILNDPGLLQSVSRIYFADLTYKHGLQKATTMYAKDAN